MFEIRWFKKNNTEEVVDLGLGNVQEIHTNMTLDTKSRYHSDRFFNHAYNPSFLGKYWCQVINTTADPDQPLMRSYVFTLLPPDNYTGQSCAISQFISKTTCADLSDSSIPASTAKNYASTTITTAPSLTTSKPSEKGLNAQLNRPLTCISMVIVTQMRLLIAEFLVLYHFIVIC